MSRFTQPSDGSGSGTPGPQGPQGVQGEQGEPGSAGDSFGIYYLGNYNSSSGYITDIAVVRGSDGQLYLAKASGQLGDPIDYQSNGQWEVWIPKGPAGAQGEPGADGISPNLESLTDLLPALDNQYTLGNSDFRWQSISVGGGTIYITDAITDDQVGLTVSDGIFFIDGIAQAQLPNVRITNLTFNDDTVQTTAAVNADWDATSGLAEILNKPTLLQGEQGIQGVQGVQGPAGNSFTLLGSYANLTAFNAGAGSSVGTLGDAYILLSDGSLMVYGAQGWFDSGDLQGPQGIQGPQGLKGDKGDTGLTGPKGDTGLKGDTGNAGAKGDTGATGAKGDTGLTGPKGDTGDTGPAGLAGAVTSYASTLSSTNLAYSGTPTSARYVANGKMVHVDIDVNLATVTNFGQNGVQYFLTLPFTAAYNGFFQGECTIAGTIYEIGASVTAGSNSLALFYNDSHGSGTPNTWELMTKQKPVNLTTGTTFHVGGIFISQ